MSKLDRLKQSIGLGSGPGAQHQEPSVYDVIDASLRDARLRSEVEARAVAEERKKRAFLAIGEALPKAYRRRAAIPCPSCRRKLLDNGSQAVLAVSVKADLAFLRCKGCGHRWKLPVVE